MGQGIAQVAAQESFRVFLYDLSQDVLQSAKKQIKETLDTGVKLGKVTSKQKDKSLENIHFITSLEEGAKSADLVIEAVPEDLSLKCNLFEKLHTITKPSCIFASNTSSLPIGEMALASQRPEYFIGMHFFNPVHKMKLVEVVRGEKTSDHTVEAASKVAKQMGKETVEVKESPGFVTTRMNALIGNEAFRMLEEGIASPEDIDRALKLGLNHPMGPFELVDLVGLDVRLSILKYLHQKLGDRFRPSSMLEKLVSEGRLGRKVGKGVYPYKKEDKL